MDLPVLPWAAQYIWGWFGELAGRSGSNGFGLNPLSFQEIAAWAQLTGRHPTPREVRWLLRLDEVMRAALAPKRDPQTEG